MKLVLKIALWNLIPGGVSFKTIGYFRGVAR